MAADKRQARGAPGPVAVVLVAVIALVATGLLVRTERNASAINAKTARIAGSARSINASTDSILQLNQTNDHASSILSALEPLSGPIAHIDQRSAEIAGLLREIRDSTLSIDTSGKSIDKSGQTIKNGLITINDQGRTVAARVGSINSDAARILADLDQIGRGVALINHDLPKTARILDSLLADSGDIVTALHRTKHLTGCIDNGLNGGGRCSSGGEE